MTNGNEKLVERLKTILYRFHGDHLGASEIDAILQQQLSILDEALAAMREEAARTIELKLVTHGDHYASYLAPSTDAKELAQAIRSLRPDLDATLGRIRAEGKKVATEEVFTALRILAKRDSGAAVNAVCEDYPELRELVQRIRDEARLEGINEAIRVVDETIRDVRDEDLIPAIRVRLRKIDHRDAALRQKVGK